MSLTTRLFIVNFAGLCGIIWAWWIGLIKLVTDADAVHMPAIVATMVSIGLLSAFWQARDVSYASTPKLLRRVRITSAHLSVLVFLLFTFGIIGTGLSLLFGFHGLAFGTTAEEAQKFGGQVIAGVGSCFGATVTGAIGAAWIEINSQMIKTAIALRELDVE